MSSQSKADGEFVERVIPASLPFTKLNPRLSPPRESSAKISKVNFSFMVEMGKSVSATVMDAIHSHPTANHPHQ